MTRRKKFSCGHRGLGRACHRCAQATVCERMSARGTANYDAAIGSGVREQGRPSSDGTRRGWSAFDFGDEAGRLREVAP